jgi:Spy/CpxP family protein refolding chaperone
MHMKTILIALGAMLLFATAAHARPSADLGPPGNDRWTDGTVQVVLTQIHLSRSQRDKVVELIGNARHDAADIEHNRRLTRVQRDDRLADLVTELRNRIVHVLTGRQKEELRDILAGRRDDVPRDRDRSDGPRSRRAGPPPDRNDWPWN